MTVRGETRVRQIVLSAAILAFTVIRTAAAESVGMLDVAVPATERGTDLQISVLYPTDADGEAVLLGDNGVFRGVPVVENAPITNGRYPLVLISFGGFRVAPDTAGWLASALAEKGFVAAIVNHPPIPGGLATPSVLDEFWLRPADLSVAITALKSEPMFADRLDMTRVGGVGFFLGGYSVLGLAGAMIDAERLGNVCSESHRTTDCEWFEEGGVDLRGGDIPRLSRSNLDSRLKVAVAVNPEFTETLADQSLSSITVPVTTISLGLPRESASDPDGSGFAAKITGSTSVAVQDARAFSSFPECKRKGAAILEDAGEGKLCEDGGNRSRAAIHVQLASMIANALNQSFPR